MSQTLVLAHSPDSDDAFMFYGLRENAVDTEGVSYRHELADIETLNRRALSGELAITAVSFHAYAFLADRYVLLPHGASFGDGYGPCVVAREEAGAPRTLSDLAGRRVAIPGALTTAALALRIYAPSSIPVVTPFDKVGEAVHARRRGRRRRHPRGPADLEGRGLPARGRPRRRLEGRDRSAAASRRQRRPEGPRAGADRRVSRALGRSIEYALEHREDALTDAMRFARGLPREKADRFVAMYVNDWTLVLRRARARGRAPAPRARARVRRSSDARDAGVGGET